MRYVRSTVYGVCCKSVHTKIRLDYYWCYIPRRSLCVPHIRLCVRPLLHCCNGNNIQIQSSTGFFENVDVEFFDSTHDKMGYNHIEVIQRQSTIYSLTFDVNISCGIVCVFAYLCEHLVAGVISNTEFALIIVHHFELCCCFVSSYLPAYQSHPSQIFGCVWKFKIACACRYNIKIAVIKSQLQNLSTLIANPVEFIIINKCAFNSVSSWKNETNWQIVFAQINSLEFQLCTFRKCSLQHRQRTIFAWNGIFKEIHIYIQYK